MDRERVDAWLEAYGRAWEEADARAIPGMFTQEAGYRAHPLGMAHTGHDGIADYWTRATAGQQDVQVRFGDPIVDGARVAAEFWTTMGSDGGPVTVAGCLLLALAPDGRCRSLRECWHETEMLLAPPPDWGRLGPDTGGSGGAVRPRRPLPLRAVPRPHLGRDGVLVYTRDAYVTETGQDPRFGTPFASGSGPAAAVEWWATMQEEGQPATLVGCSFLTFTPDGLVATGRDYWFLEPGTHTPYNGWGR